MRAILGRQGEAQMSVFHVRIRKFTGPSFLQNQRGSAAVEYGLICAGIGLAILGALNITGQELLAKLAWLLSLLG
jgi:Flp pilus assembly pilin Flp